MRRGLPVLLLLLVSAGAARAHGILIPPDRTLPPLAMVNHKVTIAVDDQVAITNVEQTFRNHTDRQLEATYVFPVPKGASVKKFSMWINASKIDSDDPLSRTQFSGEYSPDGKTLTLTRHWGAGMADETKVYRR